MILLYISKNKALDIIKKKKAWQAFLGLLTQQGSSGSSSPELCLQINTIPCEIKSVPGWRSSQLWAVRAFIKPGSEQKSQTLSLKGKVVVLERDHQSPIRSYDSCLLYRVQTQSDLQQGFLNSDSNSYIEGTFPSPLLSLCRAKRTEMFRIFNTSP